MTRPDRSATLPPGFDGWRIVINMPLDGKGRPVGWLTTNNTRTMHWSGWARIAKAWRVAAFKAYQGRIPTGLGRVRVRFQFVFADATRRDIGNFENTAKPIIDALGPTRSRVNKDGKLIVDAGIWAIPDDDPAHLERGPEMPPGTPLGRKNPVKGQVIVFIEPLPPIEEAK